MPKPEELRLTEFGSDDSDYDEDIFSSSIIHRYDKKKARWTRKKVCGVVMLSLTVLLAVAAVCITVYPFNEETCDTTTGLLPGDIIPLHYDIWLHPNLDNLTFRAKVEINIQVLNATKCLVLNSLEQNVTNIKLKLPSGEQIFTGPHSINQKHEFLLVPLSDKLQAASYILVVHYHGLIRHGLKGFYPSYYNTSDGKQRVAAVTQFEATYARHAFPCFDEPQYKATFSISIVRDKEHTALSNMPINKTVSLENGLEEDRFQKSVKMSTYLVAFMVMDFSYRAANTSTGKLIRVWSRTDTHHQTEYALKCAVAIMEYYEKTFGIPFPLPKQDLVAVPDFNSGAMENWGLITYRETSILYDPVQTSNAFKRRVVSVIAHEMAHQWFGNLVTMKWWNDLWLNEGFASYMEYVASDVVEPNMGMQMYLQKNGMQRALSADSYSNSHPISSEANTPVAIAEMFDAISYRKGACIIRMMHEVMGDTLFFSGIKTYLETYKYSNAVQKQLYTALNERAQELRPPVDIEKFMNSWTLQMGYPIVSVKFVGGNVVNISQSKYTFGDDTQPESPLGYQWEIPFWYKSNTEDDVMKWLSGKSLEFEVPEGTDWMLGNSLARGFYRVTYDEENWEKIINLLINKHESFHQVDRMKIIDDLTSLSQVLADVDVTWALHASTYLKNEESLYTLTGSLASLSRIFNKLSVLDEYTPAISKYWLNILVPVIDRIVMEPSDSDSFETGLFRGVILSEAAQHGHQECVEYAKKLYQEHLSTGNQVDPNLFSFVYGTVALNCSTDEWNAMFEEYSSETIQSKQRYLMKALASTFNMDIIRTLLNYTMDENKVRQQDARILLMYISMGSYDGNYQTWTFLRENWNYFYETYGKSNAGLDVLLESVIGQLYKQEDLDQVTKFFDNRDDMGSAEHGIRKGLEAARHRISWLEEHKARAGGWLTTNFSDQL